MTVECNKSVGSYFVYFYYKNEKTIHYFAEVLVCNGLETEKSSGSSLGIAWEALL